MLVVVGAKVTSERDLEKPLGAARVVFLTLAAKKGGGGKCPSAFTSNLMEIPVALSPALILGEPSHVPACLRPHWLTLSSSS